MTTPATSRRARVVLHAPVAHRHHARQPTGDVLVVRDHHDRRALVVQPVEQVEDGRAGGLVEVAGGLVGEQDPRRVHERPGDGDPLALAARQLGRRVPRTGPEPDAVERLAGPTQPLGSSDALVEQPVGDVLDRGPSVEQEELLEHEPQVHGAHPGQRGVRQRGDVVARRAARAPSMGRSSAPMTCRSVDLPEPDGPTTAM